MGVATSIDTITTSSAVTDDRASSRPSVQSRATFNPTASHRTDVGKGRSARVGALRCASNSDAMTVVIKKDGEAQEGCDGSDRYRDNLNRVRDVDTSSRQQDAFGEQQPDIHPDCEPPGRPRKRSFIAHHKLLRYHRGGGDRALYTTAVHERNHRLDSGDL